MAAEDYVGPVGHEKKVHKTHFEGVDLRHRKPPSDDPDWEKVGAGRWKYNPKKRIERSEGSEVTNG